MHSKRRTVMYLTQVNNMKKLVSRKLYPYTVVCFLEYFCVFMSFLCFSLLFFCIFSTLLYSLISPLFYCLLYVLSHAMNLIQTCYLLETSHFAKFTMVGNLAQSVNQFQIGLITCQFCGYDRTRTQMYQNAPQGHAMQCDACLTISDEVQVLIVRNREKSAIGNDRWIETK